MKTTSFAIFTNLFRSTTKMPRLFFLLLSLVLAAPAAWAEANYVYHERSTNNVGAGQPYVSVLAPDFSQSVTVRFKSEFQFFTNQARVYYTTDGSTPAGAFGTGTGTTQVVSAVYEATFGGPLVDVVRAVIPAQAAGKTVKYIISAWHSGGGLEIFGNGPGTPCSCGAPTSSSAQAMVSSYTVAGLTPTVTTGAPDVTTTTATLKATVNPGGLETTVDFYVDSVFVNSVSAGSGGTSTQVTLPAGPYTPGTMHNVYAFVSNSAGDATGSTENFTLLGGEPSITTLAPDPVTTTTARLRAQVDPNLVETTVDFYVDGGFVNSVVVLANAGVTTATLDISGYIPGTVHNVEARASSLATVPVGPLSGGSVPLTFLGGEPTITTLAPDQVTITTARLRAQVNPNLVETTVDFYVDGAFVNSVVVLANAGPTTATLDISGYVPGTLHDVEAYARNLATTITTPVDGGLVPLTFLGGVPSITTLAPDQVTITTARLRAQVNPNLVETTVDFYVDGGFVNSVVVLANEGPTTVTLDVSGYIPGTTHEVTTEARNLATVPVGPVLGGTAPLTFLGGVPTITTLAADQITTTTARLRAQVNPNLVETTVDFYLGGNFVNSVIVPANEGTTIVTLDVSGQVPGTSPVAETYAHSLATTLSGNVSGGSVPVTFLGGAPTIMTLAPTITSGATATLRASVDPNLTETTVSFYIDDLYVGQASAGDGDDAVTVTVPATGLVENQSYNVRADASNTHFTNVTGNTVSFTVTPPAPSALFTDWTSYGPGSQVNGTLPTPGGPVGVAYEGDGAGADLNNASTNFSRPETFTPPLVTSDSVATYGSPGTHHKLTFAGPVSGIVMHWWSVGTPIVPVRLTFTKDGTTTPASFEIISSGPNEYGDGPFEREGAGNNVLHGEEGNGTIRFDGTFTTLEWDSDAYEVFFVFQVGAEVASQGVITDRFTLNGTTRVAGASLNGLQTETGNVTWSGRNAYVFTADGNLIVPLPTPPEGGVNTRVMSVPYTPPVGETVTIQGDIRPPYLHPDPTVWGSIGFCKDPSPYIDHGFYNPPVGQLWMVLTSEGGWGVIARDDIPLASGVAPIFHADTFNRCRLTYNTTTNTVSLSINGVNVLTDHSLGSFTPTIERAGFMFHRVDGGGFDNFAVIEGALPTPAAPSATAGTVTNITTTGATLHATVYPGNLNTTVEFYVDGDLYDSTYVLPGNSAVPASLPVSGLTPGSSHSVYVVVTNSVDTDTSNTVNFTLEGDAPTITTNAATLVTGTTATLNATVNPNHFATTVDFYLGVNFAGSVNVPAGASPVPVSLPITGLTGGTSYSYSASATNVVGTTPGNTVNFTTLSAFPEAEIGVTLLRSDLAPNGPDEALFALIRPPSLNAAGHIAFKGTAFVREATELDPNPITTNNDMMIWADKGLSPLMLIAREGDTPPGLPGTTFLNFSEPIQSANDGVTFKAQLKRGSGVVANNDEVFFSDLGGSLTKVVRESDPIAGTGSALYKSFTSAAAVDDGVFGVAMLGNGSSEIVNGNNDVVLWAWAPGDTQPSIRLREGDSITISVSPMVARTVKNFEALTAKAGVVGQGRSFNNQPEVLVRANCTDGTVAYVKLSSDLAFLDQREVVTAIIKGTSLVSSSGPAEPASSTFAALEVPAINALGHRAFRGSVAQRKATVPPTFPAITSANDAGIWADQGSTPLALIAREGETAPGTSSTFFAFGDPIIADNDSVAFMGTLKSGAGISGTNNQGLWATTDTGLQLVARKGSTVNGVPTAAVVNSFATAVVNNNGGAFTGKLRTGAGGVTANSDAFLAFWRKSDGAANVVLREGMWLEVSPGHPRALKSFDVFTPQAPFAGVGRSHNATGDMAVSCIFTDGTTGVFILNEEVVPGGGGGGPIGGGPIGGGPIGGGPIGGGPGGGL